MAELLSLKDNLMYDIIDPFNRRIYFVVYWS